MQNMSVAEGWQNVLKMHCFAHGLSVCEVRELRFPSNI